LKIDVPLLADGQLRGGFGSHSCGDASSWMAPLKCELASIRAGITSESQRTVWMYAKYARSLTLSAGLLTQHFIDGCGMREALFGLQTHS